ncbi:MAG: hypothetical protein LBP58_07430 [Azoarcus sp.]|jgi:ABC-type bacteriocin/lantibiotic exporter with double-glycine peptidase domain|nr:hypothetical protein [Azoarcus sp.]
MTRPLEHWLARGIDSNKRDDLRTGFAWLYGFVAARRFALAGLLALALLASLLALLQPWLMKHLLDDALLARDPELLAMLAAAMIAVGLFATALAGLNRYLHTRLSGQILFALRADLYRHLQTLSPAFFGERRTATRRAVSRRWKASPGASRRVCARPGWTRRSPRSFPPRLAACTGAAKRAPSMRNI